MESNDLVDYSRQENLNNDLRLNTDSFNNLQIIIGCGGIGFWLGIMLAMMGYNKFYLIEGEKIDATNLNRIPIPQTWIGLNKGVALRKTIRHLRPNTSITVLTQAIDRNDPNMFKEIIDLLGRTYQIKIWDTTDDAIVQKLMYKVLKGFNYEFLYTKIGYEGFKIGIYNNLDVWINPETYQPGYTTSKANAVTSAISAGLGMFYSMLNLKDDKNFNLKNLLTEKSNVKKEPLEETESSEMAFPEFTNEPPR